LDQRRHLPDLIRLCLSVTSRLQIDDVRDAFPAVNAMASLRPFLKSEPIHKVTQVIKADVGIGCATEDLLANRIVFAHATGSGGGFV
jgi:hypothetical protein